MKLNDIKLNCSYTNLAAYYYDETAPTPLDSPYLLSFNPSAAQLIDLDQSEANTQAFIDVINGEKLLKGSKPFSMCYAGHQFGYYVPRLGDGRAINLGETLGWQLQLKGAGKSLYSRQGDGRAVLRSSIREYLMSEAMHALGVPTTRALAIIGSEEKVQRATREKGAIVLRMSPSWVRFGTFEYFYYRDEYEELEALANYVLHQSFPHLEGKEDAYALMYEEIVIASAELMAHWQAIGFNHGVMNTDNMSIASLTIDYGPFSFLDQYEFNFTCNHTDEQGRYAFGNQPPIAYWNLSMLAEALSPLLKPEKSEKILEGFSSHFTQKYLALMRAKLGLEHAGKEDVALIKELLSVLGELRLDYSYFFRTLSHYQGDRSQLLRITTYKEPLSKWLDAYDKRLKKEKSRDRNQKMCLTNPKYVLKNYILQEAIDKAEKGEHSLVNELLTLAQNPFDEHPEFEKYAQVTPDEYTNLKLSCSS